MCANNGQHISAHAPKKGFFGYSKVNNFDFFGDFVKDNIFWFNIAMTNISVMEIC